jgi:hypothetical protein
MSQNPENFTVSSHFEGKSSEVRKTYDRLLDVSGQFGPVLEEPKKTSIHLVNVSAFAGVATRKDYLILTIKSNHKLDSPRIHKTEQASARRFHSEIKLASPADIDDELIGWLKDAYALS